MPFDPPIGEAHTMEVAEGAEEVGAAVVEERRGPRGVAVVELARRRIAHRPDTFAGGPIEPMEDILLIGRVAVAHHHSIPRHGDAAEPLVEEDLLPANDFFGGKRRREPRDVSRATGPTPLGPVGVCRLGRRDAVRRRRGCDQGAITFSRRCRFGIDGHEASLRLDGEPQDRIVADREEGLGDRGANFLVEGAVDKGGDEGDFGRLRHHLEIPLLDRPTPFEERLGVARDHGGHGLPLLPSLDHLLGAVAAGLGHRGALRDDDPHRCQERLRGGMLLVARGRPEDQPMVGEIGDRRGLVVAANDNEPTLGRRAFEIGEIGHRKERPLRALPIGGDHRSLPDDDVGPGALPLADRPHHLGKRFPEEHLDRPAEGFLQVRAELRVVALGVALHAWAGEGRRERIHDDERQGRLCRRKNPRPSDDRHGGKQQAPTRTLDDAHGDPPR